MNDVTERVMLGSRGEIIRKEGLDEYYVPDVGLGESGEWDWAASFAQDIQDEEIVQVRFKNNRRAFYVNRSMLSLQRGDVVAVAALGGHDIGVVCLTGWLARRTYLKQNSVTESEEREGEPLQELYRKATQQDVSRWMESIDREYETMVRARLIAQEMHLQMKISDVEFQGDGSKALFYYSAEQRVDFRELVRNFAGEFKVRIEMRQIGPRQEAARIGGIGSCGRRICCGGWLRKFSSVTTSMIKLQDLTPNPQKQAGQCGKLKCCLNFEVGVYEDAKRRMPRVKVPLQFEDGILYYIKSDLFRECMYFATAPKSSERLIMLTCAQVEQVLALNHSGRKAPALTEFQLPEEDLEEATSLGYGNVIEEESLTRFDKTRKRANKHRKPQQGQGGVGTKSGEKVASNPSPAVKKEGNTAKDLSSDEAVAKNLTPKEGGTEQKKQQNGGQKLQRHLQDRRGGQERKPQASQASAVHPNASQVQTVQGGEERKQQQQKPKSAHEHRSDHHAQLQQGERKPAPSSEKKITPQPVEGEPTGASVPQQQEKRKPFHKHFRGRGQGQTQGHSHSQAQSSEKN